jgi:S1-C subfamily serine protease
VSLLAQLSTELGDLVARVAPAVVGLWHRRGQGSGLVLARDGYILTNSHVARARRDLRVRLSGSDGATAELVGADERTDLAVVRAEVGGRPSLALAQARVPRVGALAVAIGNPLGFERSVTLGVVSALYRDLPTPAGGLLEGLIQTDAAVNPGSSGGPLVDVEGAVVGITTAMIPYAGGLGFAIPAGTASWVAAVLIQHGEIRRPYLGIVARGEELDGLHAGRTRGVRILRVETQTPAERSGLRAGDVLLAANESPVATIDDLQRVMVLQSPPEIGLDVLRGHQRHRLSIEPDPRGRAA